MIEAYSTSRVLKLVDPDQLHIWSAITYLGFLQGSFRVVNFTGWKVKWKLILPCVMVAGKKSAEGWERVLWLMVCYGFYGG